MPSSLRDNVNSGYIEAANRMRSKRGRRRIVAYVESYDDVFFWRTVLTPFENEERYFEVMLPSRINLKKGKKPVLMNLIGNRTGRDMIACVDADYDYLLGGATKLSRDVRDNPHVLHTYAYAIENYQCYAPSLHTVCVMATLNDRQVFNFESYLAAYSEIIHPLFVWNIWHYRNGTYSQFTMTDFNRVIETGNINIEHPELSLEHLRRKVQTRLRSLQAKHKDSLVEVGRLQDELQQMGITPQTTYLYIQGHYLWDKIAVPILKRVCNRLRQQRENEIHRNARHGTQLRNELASYTHSTADINLMLRRNVGYADAMPYRQLLQDVEKAIR